MTSSERADLDSPWKLMLQQYFQPALQFFFPKTEALIDWSRSIEFLDKEFVRIAREAELGRRYADQLVRVWLKRGQELWLLVHVEIQAQPEAKFAERMFIYNVRIFEFYGHAATSLAILCDGNPRWRPQHYGFAYPDTQLDFRFGTAKLVDYKLRWQQLEQSNNPFATVVMAHLKAQETRQKLKQRKEWKLSLMRRLYERGMARQDIMNLYRFLDWVMTLPKGLESEFLNELRQYEESQQMPYVTSAERFGFERGLEQGLEQGEQEERRTTIDNLLRLRFGEIDQTLAAIAQTIACQSDEAYARSLLSIATDSREALVERFQSP